MNDYDSPTVNIPLLRKAVEWVEFQASLPEIDREWYQARYIAPPDIMAMSLIEVSSDTTSREYRQQLSALTNHCGTAYCVAGYVGQLASDDYKHTDQAGDVHVAEFARQELGLTNEESQRLFAGENDAAAVRRIAESIAGEAL
jgi:hypothetical protein